MRRREQHISSRRRMLLLELRVDENKLLGPDLAFLVTFFNSLIVNDEVNV